MRNFDITTSLLVSLWDIFHWEGDTEGNHGLSERTHPPRGTFSRSKGRILGHFSWSLAITKTIVGVFRDVKVEREDVNLPVCPPGFFCPSPAHTRRYLVDTRHFWENMTGDFCTLLCPLTNPNGLTLQRAFIC